MYNNNSYKLMQYFSVFQYYNSLWERFIHNPKVLFFKLSKNVPIGMHTHTHLKILTCMLHALSHLSENQALA